MFYLPDGIKHNIYVCPVSHGGAPTVTFPFWGYLQAFWRGFCLRRRLKAALATAPASDLDLDEDDFFEEAAFEELDAFFFKQVSRMRHAGDLIGTKKSFLHSGKC